MTPSDTRTKAISPPKKIARRKGVFRTIWPCRAFSAGYAFTSGRLFLLRGSRMAAGFESRRVLRQTVVIPEGSESGFRAALQIAARREYTSAPRSTPSVSYRVEESAHVELPHRAGARPVAGRRKPDSGACWPRACIPRNGWSAPRSMLRPCSLPKVSAGPEHESSAKVYACPRNHRRYTVRGSNLGPFFVGQYPGGLVAGPYGRWATLRFPRSC